MAYGLDHTRCGINMCPCDLPLPYRHVIVMFYAVIVGSARFKIAQCNLKFCYRFFTKFQIIPRITLVQEFAVGGDRVMQEYSEKPAMYLAGLPKHYSNMTPLKWIMDNMSAMLQSEEGFRLPDTLTFFYIESRVHCFQTTTNMF